MKQNKPTKNGDEEEPPEGFLNIREAAAALHVTVRFIAQIKKDGAPFYYGKTRRDWLEEFTHKNATDESRRKNCCNECMFYCPRPKGNDAEAWIEFEI